MEGMLTIGSDDDTPPKPPKPITKPTKSAKPATKSRSKPPRSVKPATNIVDGEDVKMEGTSTTGLDNSQKKPGQHHPDIYNNLSREQCNFIHEEAQKDMQAFLSFNLPLSNNTRNWIRQGQPVLAIAACYSLKLAALVFILSNGWTVCPYHCIHKEAKAKDADSQRERLMMWVDAINGEISDLQGDGDGKKARAGSGASSSKCALEYVEVPDVQVGSEGGSGEGTVPNDDIVDEYKIDIGGGRKGVLSNPDIVGEYEVDKGKGRAAAMEDLLNDSNYNGSDSDSDGGANDPLQSPSSLKRFSQLDLDLD
ncbi:hypothetical protein H1R20_g15049, partial [Candolleomyces eurysporus]